MSVESPCRNICTLDAAQTHCTACLRTLAEIAGWGRMSDTERRAVLDEIARRQAR